MPLEDLSNSVLKAFKRPSNAFKRPFKGLLRAFKRPLKAVKRPLKGLLKAFRYILKAFELFVLTLWANEVSHALVVLGLINHLSGVASQGACSRQIFCSLEGFHMHSEF